ncbi:uncharacterized protein LOC131658028 [Vicia villosa]|uniref:uncharacterized protein LOC131658027 n=1 Tax=Vicia villosa TaxID=3911 RepID=UPI00273B0A33|nr:uncharacterized protein LOC131658027 [Vicia villosa]XP_058783346.1 uncharacterized protein LOC131658028 [Vicia villosa]
MADTKFIAEGGSSHRPPYFNDNNMWSVVENGNYTPMTTATDTVPSVPKIQSQWTKEENDKVLLNSKAQFILSCALSREEYDRIEECTTAKEIWDSLKIHHEGTSHVKEERIDLGVRKFETFEMKEEETIDEMFSRFTVIVNELRSLGKAYTAHERIRKILRCLPKIWRPMVTTISQAKDLKILQVEELIGSLRAHEGILNEDKPQRKGKMIALKTSQNSASQISTSQGTNEEETGFLSEDENDLALISRRIQQMILKRNQNRRSFQPRKDYQKPEIDKSKITCYGCNKLGHFKTECPHKTQRNFSSKKKSMLAQWDDSENSNSEAEDEEANLCLMTNSDSEEVSTPNFCYTCKEIGIMFDNLLEDSNILTQKCLFQREQIHTLKTEKEDLIKSNSKHLETIKELQKAYSYLSLHQKAINEKFKPSSNQDKIKNLESQVETLTKDMTSFVKSTETFQKIMGSQSGVFDKAGLGFKQSENQMIYENFFLPKKNRTKTQIKEKIPLKKKDITKPKCCYCKKTNHFEKHCYFKRKTNVSTNHVSNNKGPKEIWVAKRLLTLHAGMSSNPQEKALVPGQWMLKTYD